MSGGKVFQLQGNQRSAAEPADNVWLSASAGTGKTQVLSARVLRLLLRPEVDPSQLLCLTFTKAGAAEMANRINAVLTRWVRLEDTKLYKELEYLGATPSTAVRERARTLFASVLDCPGGGLRIDTIHAFAQWLLSNFPEEAGLPPGARPMEDRERELLLSDVLTELITQAQTTGDARLLDAITRFTTSKDPAALQAWLARCAGATDLWHGAQGWQRPMDARVRQLLDMPASADETWACEGLHPDIFPDDQLQKMLSLMRSWNAKTGAETAQFIERWLALEVEERSGALDGFLDTVLTKDGKARAMKKPSKEEPRLKCWQAAVAQAVAMVQERRGLLALADFLTSALELGQAFALSWEAAKRRAGLIDFDDLIRTAARLLSDTDASDWIRYKLDRQFNHILIDEAQDTNQAQWDIVEALIDDFFTGEGAAGDTLRTIFTVGDYKQAIFGFQGTSPENFAKAREKVFKRIAAAREHAEELRENRRLPTWQPLDLGQSFRTSRPVLDFVNQAIEALGHGAFGLDRPPGSHLGEDGPGLVTLWNPVLSAADDVEGEDEERGWLPTHEIVMAEKIAEQVRRWVSGDEPFVLAKGGSPRHAEAGDIMVLVRKRRELASQIVAKLHDKGVAVAGVDRLRLGAPLAVKDLLAALKFAAQPLDDLSLANLLASPLIGWSQDDLLAYVPRPKGTRLWDHLRQSDHPSIMPIAEKLRELLRLADFETPQALLAWLLNGPWQGRARLIERLGREANDPLDELLNSAFAYEAVHTPSLAGFIHWFEAGTAEVKRDADSTTGQVRVLTVHGSKGLQAPIVILADAAGAPSEARELSLTELKPGDQTGRAVPLPPLAKSERVGPVSAAQAQAATAEMQEHWRLLYVAMTRAEEALFIGGSLGPRDAKQGKPHDDSWHARLEPIFEQPPLFDPLWGERREWGRRAAPLASTQQQSVIAPLPALPAWATTPIGPEPRPPRPLAPSAAGEEQGADPPLPPGAPHSAARRGILIHRLLERLPDVAPDERFKAATRWLARQADDLPPAMREEMAASALGVLDDPAFAELFTGAALAEVPLAATIGGIVVTGTVDRLLVREHEVIVVDYKTTRRPPLSIDDIPSSALRQMAAYAAALEAIYPGREVRAALLYTHAPQLFELDQEMLAPHKDRLGDQQESYALPVIE